MYFDTPSLIKFKQILNLVYQCFRKYNRNKLSALKLGHTMLKSYKDILISAIVGGAFFAVPYIGLGLSVLPSLGIAAVAFGAGNLMLSESNKPKPIVMDVAKDDNRSFLEKITTAKRQNAEIYALMHRVEKPELIEDIKQLHAVIAKIIVTIEKAPE